MSQVKPLSTYPKEYFVLFTLAEKNSGHSIPDLSFSDCEALKWDLYRFRKAGTEENHPEAPVWKSFILRPIQQNLGQVKRDSLWTLSICNGVKPSIMGKICKSLGSGAMEEEAIRKTEAKIPDIFIDMGLEPTPIPKNPLADHYGSNVLKRRGKDVDK